MSTSTELRVFISSTFRDLQEEREHLVKKIFPEIRALCRERGITFTEVDLRWGLTEEQLALGQVIRTCLEEVDKCRPYFIGITGSRYGYIPTHLDLFKDPTLLQRHPWLEDAVVDEMSITEMEAHYGVLRSMEEAERKTSVPDDGRNDREPNAGQGRALFFFRTRPDGSDGDVDDDERTRLDVYQQRIRRSGATIEEFDDPEALGHLTRQALLNIMDNDFADAKPPSPLEEERARHAAFAQSRRRAYIPNPAHLKRLNDHVASNDPPLVVYAESGSGKSSLFAYWSQQYQRKNPDAHVIEHYVGIGATATDHFAIIRHVCEEINERFGRDEQIPTDPEKLETALGQWFGYVDHDQQRARGGGGREESNEQLTDTPASDSTFILHPSSFTATPSSLIVILDGLNQLQGEALKLRWIPDVIAPSIRMILSSTVEGTLVELEKRGWGRYGMQALSEAERETIVVRYLAEFSKSLNPDQIKRLAADHKCGHPLFLKTVLEELRVVGRHEELDVELNKYLETTGTEDLFQRVLERLETDYTPEAVREVMSLLTASRSGLDERELSEISGLSRLVIGTLIAGLDYHLVKKEGRLTFFHDYLRRAVEKRYLADKEEPHSTHLKVAGYFQGGVTASITTGTDVSVRMAGELAYQLQAAGEQDRVRECLSTMPVFLALYGGQTQYEVLRYWSSMQEGIDIAGSYRKGLSEWSMDDAAQRSRGIGSVTDLLERLGQWTAAIELGRERLTLAIEHIDTSEEASSRRSLGDILQLRGEYGEALSELTIALDLCEELGDRSGTASAVGSMGHVYYRRGEYDRALECYQRWLRISEELDDRHGRSRAIGNMGNVYFSHAEYEQALECYQRQLNISEESGDRRGVAFVLGNIGAVYYRRGEYEQALECYMRQLSISEGLGDRRGVAIAIGSVGVVYANRGEYDRALECHQRCLRISEDLGDRGGIARVIGNMGVVYSSRGEYDRALECFQRQLSISEELGDRGAIAFAIGSMGVVYTRLGDNERALECYQRKLNISEELGDRSSVATAIGNMGVVHASRGEYEQALECYQRQLSISEELGARGGVASAIGNMGDVYYRRGECERALASFHRSAVEHRVIGNRKSLHQWLRGMVDVLLDIIDNAVEMPEYLPKYIIGATGSTWRDLSLHAAREIAEESLAISRELSKGDALLSSQVVLARITAAEGDVEQARQQLATLIDEVNDREHRAELYYRLWKLRSTDANHRAEALRLYQSLIEHTSKQEYRTRIHELTASTTPEAADSAEQ